MESVMLQNLWNSRRLILSLLACLAGMSVCLAQDRKLEEPSLTADQIVARMMQRNEERAAALKAYTGRRVYQLQYHGFPSDREAELVVEMRYTAPFTKEFEIVSQTGSKFICDRVLKRLVAGEQEAQGRDNRQETALSSRNYNFSLVGQEATPQGPVYKLKVEPKHKNKFLYRGTVWVNGWDFAVLRIEGEPAKNPSFWLSKTLIEQRYVQVGSFWLPALNKSTSYIRLGGNATLTIDYRDYVVHDGQSAGARSKRIDEISEDNPVTTRN
jgi:hypothetical protein